MNKSKKRSKFVSVLVYNRLFLLALALIMQGFIFFSFIKWLTPYITYYFGGSVVVFAAFFIYLANRKGKIEFRVAWLLPTIIAPVFGIFLYIVYHLNRGGLWLKRELNLAKQKNVPYFKADLENNVYTPDMRSQDLAAYLKSTSNYPAYKDCRLTFLDSGEIFFDDFLLQIEQAQKFIFIEFFIIYPDSAFEKMIEALKHKVDQGVEVRMMFDAFGSTTLATKRNLKYLRSLGIHAEIFLPVIPVFATHQNNRDHRKIVVIDNRIAYTGGVNVADEYFNYIHPRFNYWKDTAVRLEGPSVKTFTGMFLENWNITVRKKDRSESFDFFFNQDTGSFPSQSVVIPYGDEAPNDEDIAENVYKYILGKATKYVHITSPYFIVDSSLTEALCFAARRGIDVKIIVPAKHDHFITFCLGRLFLKTLIDNGIEVYEYTPGFIHAKEFISDDSFATIGSVNLDYRSLYHHFECGVFMENDPAIASMEQDFQDTLKDSHQITAQEYKKIPARIKLIGFLFKVFAPLM